VKAAATALTSETSAGGKMNLQKELLRNVQFVFSTLSCSARAQMTDLPFPKNLVIDEGNVLI
jgi:hypothetical protein